MKALLLIDIQNDFLPGGSLAVPGGDDIIKVVNSIQHHFDLIVATQDWHPDNHKSFASNHPGKKVFEEIELNGLRQVLWPDHCVQGTEGASFSKKLETNKIEAIFRKGTDSDIDSYSGFYDNGHLKSTALSAYLKGKQVNEVYIAGLAADYCVYYTALDALKDEFAVCVIEDAVRAISEEGFAKSKADVLRRGGHYSQSASIQ